MILMCGISNMVEAPKVKYSLIIEIYKFSNRRSPISKFYA
jgi:hypothetical protein